MKYKVTLSITTTNEVTADALRDMLERQPMADEPWNLGIDEFVIDEIKSSVTPATEGEN